MIYIPRNITEEILDALTVSPVVLLNGARQTGKSTLVQWIAKKYDFDYVTLDDYSVLNAATNDPVGYLSAFKKKLIIDEIQRAPQLFLTIKQLVDKNRQPGKFLLTGSANVLMLPKLSESLAGRVEIITLWPFSCDEIIQKKSMFIDHLFSKDFSFIHDENEISRIDLMEKMIKGGYPEIHKLTSERRQLAWFKSYIATILSRDITEISKIEGLQQFPQLLSLIANQSGNLANMSSLSRDTGLVMMTLKRYLALLEATFLVKRLPAWFRNVGKRLIKTPKLYLTDTGLFSYLMGAGQSQLEANPKYVGQLTESFVMQELSKQATWSATMPNIFYYRSVSGKEVDFVLENRADHIVGIEVKAAATVRASDFAGLKELRSLVGGKFIRGIVMYTGNSTVPFGENLFAVPMSGLWMD
ncbi:MAG: DUF4143 domain-containing protein [Candidatus Lokiarchaeota archaeon]|nr:DUF4143 domain-containing protein [Candidatus Lokiarchaeota archaeon]